METSEVFNITALYPQLYSAKKGVVELIEVPLLRTLAIAGQGATDGPRYKESVAALYAVVESIKKVPQDDVLVPEGYTDFVTPPLEALWSMNDGQVFDATKPELWRWELMLVVPGFITQKIVKHAITLVESKAPNQYYGDLHITTLEEKQAVQTLHLGSYENEAADLALMQKLMAKNNLKPSARHHEVYLNSPRQVKTAQLKTILRQPVVPAKAFV